MDLVKDDVRQVTSGGCKVITYMYPCLFHFEMSPPHPSHPSHNSIHSLLVTSLMYPIDRLFLNREHSTLGLPQKEGDRAPVCVMCERSPEPPEGGRLVPHTGKLSVRLSPL